MVQNLVLQGLSISCCRTKIEGRVFLLKVLIWLVLIVVLNITVPIMFIIFPISRDWADTFLNLIWSPFKSVFI